MARVTKESLLREIRRLTIANGGKPPGRELFERRSGIKRSEWYPRLWLRWSDALAEAGYPANVLMPKLSDELLIQSYIRLTRELGRLPVSGEIRQKGMVDKTFPSHKVFERFGSKDEVIAAVDLHCRDKPECGDIAALCATYKPRLAPPAEGSARRVVTGFVYLMKSGRHFKIGRTNSLGRRGSELTIKIPVPPKTIHSIETDDPIGVEAYWHRRFADKRGEGEWFTLSSDDVQAFKRWKRIV